MEGRWDLHYNLFNTLLGRGLRVNKTISVLPCNSANGNGVLHIPRRNCCLLWERGCLAGACCWLEVRLEWEGRTMLRQIFLPGWKKLNSSAWVCAFPCQQNLGVGGGDKLFAVPCLRVSVLTEFIFGCLETRLLGVVSSLPGPAAVSKLGFQGEYGLPKEPLFSSPSSFCSMSTFCSIFSFQVLKTVLSLLKSWVLIALFYGFLAVPKCSSCKKNSEVSFWGCKEVLQSIFI